MSMRAVAAPHNSTTYTHTYTEMSSICSSVRVFVSPSKFVGTADTIVSACMHTYIHTYIHTCIHTYIHAYIHTYIHTYMHTYTHTCIHTYIHTYMHAYIHAYRYIHA